MSIRVYASGALTSTNFSFSLSVNRELTVGTLTSGGNRESVRMSLVGLRSLGRAIENQREGKTRTPPVRFCLRLAEITRDNIAILMPPIQNCNRIRKLVHYKQEVYIVQS